MTCPITGGRQTKMMRPTFDKICAKNRQRAAEYDRQSWNQGKLMDVSCCKECGGEIPEELEFFDEDTCKKKDQEDVEVAIATKRGKCDLCGVEKNVKPNNGIKVCSSCASVQSTIKKNPDAVAKEYARLTGSEIINSNIFSGDIADRIRAALAVPPSTPVDAFPDLITELTIRSVKHAMEIDSVRKVLDVDDGHGDESLVDIAKMRMQEIGRLAFQAAQIRDIIGADAGEPLVNAVRAKIEELKELKVDLLQREQCEYMEIDHDPSAIPIGRLLTDKKLRQKIDELAAVLDGYFT